MSNPNDTIRTGKHTPSSEKDNGASSGAGEATRSHRSSDTGSGQLEVRCPNCHAPTPVAVDTRLTDLTCSACGSHFSLVDQSQETRMAPSLSTLGRFELIERIGVGGFGSVWKVRDKELDRTVAIKVPRAAGMTPDEQEKFFREARAAAQLRHPSIVSVHEVGRDGESIYIVSDFVRGVTLGEWLSGQQLTGREAAELTAKIADALQHAHEQGVVHRDLKPANIMIDGDGEPHLMDFGLARRDAGEITVTLDGQVLGTPAYMSPEQAVGKGHEADRRSDIYSLGVILFQLLTGELPFRGSSRMLIHQVLNDPAPSPRKLNANVRKDLETITLKCLEKDPDKRYQSAREFADDSRRYLRGEPIQARPAGVIERGWSWAKRRPTSAALLALLAAAAVVAPLVATRQSALRSSAQSAEAIARNAEMVARAAEKKARDEAARAEKEAAIAKRLANVAGAKYALTQGRVKESYQQIAAAIRSQPSLEYGQILDSAIRDARREWQLLQRIPVDRPATWGCFVGLGPRWLAVSDGAAINLRSLIRNEQLGMVELPGGGHAPAAIGVDRLAVANDAGEILIYSLPSFKLDATCPFPGRVVEIRCDGDASHIAALGDAGLVRVFDAGGKMLAERQFPPAGMNFQTTPSLDISPSGKTIAYEPGWWAKPKMTWKWQTDEVKTFDVELNQLRLVSDEIGLSHIGGADVKPGGIGTVDLATGETSWTRCSGRMLYEEKGRLEHAPGDSNQEMALVCDAAINLLNRSGDPRSPKIEAHVTRYDSLWPQESVAPRFLNYDCSSHTLALATDREILLFAMWLPNAQDSFEVSTELNTRDGMLAAAGDVVFTCDSAWIYQCNIRTLERKTYVLQSPATAKSVTAIRLAVTPDAAHCAVLWQESDPTKDGSAYLRKIVQVYELRDAANNSQLTPKSEFELKDFFGGTVFSTGNLILTPDARTVAWCDHDWGIGGYRAADGEKLYQLEAPADPTYAVAADGKLLGVGDFRVAGQYRIWNVQTGKEVAHFPLEATVRRATFAPDADSLYVATSADKLRKYRVRDGKLLSEIATPLTPIKIAPDNELCIGFIAEAERAGSMVLAHLGDGQALEVINAESFLLYDGHFASDGSTMAFIAEFDTCRIMKSPDLADAVRRLEHSAIDTQLATQATDAIDYREILAARQELAAAQAEEREWESAEDIYQTAIGIRRQLANDFPLLLKHKEMLADSLERRVESTAEEDPFKASEMMKEALALRAEMVKAKPDDAAYAEKLARAQSQLKRLRERSNSKLPNRGQRLYWAPFGQTDDAPPDQTDSKSTTNAQ